MIINYFSTDKPHFSKGKKAFCKGIITLPLQTCDIALRFLKGWNKENGRKY